MNFSKTEILGSLIVVLCLGAGALGSSTAHAASPTPSASPAPDVAATVEALHLAGTITGGLLPPEAPEFAQMISSIQAGDHFGAAMAATGSKYFAQYLVRRIAKQMMNPTLTGAGVTDSDATTAIIANLIGSGTTANISRLWSDNNTYLVKVIRAGTPSNQHILSLTAAELAAMDFRTDLVAQPGQNAVDLNKAAVMIPVQHVGGYLTLSDRVGDTSIAQYGLTAGTNLRAIESFYEVSMGLSLTDMIVMNNVKPEVAPRFIPETDPNFFVGQGQGACMSCHAGGASNLTHGYAAFADVFDYNGNGLTYIAAPTTSTRKSLGSNAGNRGNVATCADPTKTVCNPDSYGADPNQAWDLTTWQQGGLLARMGWTGPITGQGLNALGQALGKASLVYQFMVQRVMGEVCPLGTISSADQFTIANTAASRDSFSYIVAAVASNPACR